MSKRYILAKKYLSWLEWQQMPLAGNGNNNARIVAKIKCNILWDNP